MVTLLALGVGMGLATTCTLYLWVGISFLLLSLVFVIFVPLLTKGFVPCWVGLDLFCWDCCWGLGPNSRYILIFLIRVGCGWSLVLQGLHLII